MLADDETIPPDLRRYVSEFELPSGAKIRWMIASFYDLEGWVLDLGFQRFVYADGTTGSLPRHRVYEELGFPGGEDDLKTDEDWRAVREAEAALTKDFFMTLPQAWQVAQECGAANRHARQGEVVELRESGKKVTVVNPGTEHDRGHYLRVADENGKEQTVALWRLILPD